MINPFTMMDWTLNINTLIQMGVMIVTVAAFFFGMRGEVRVLRHDVRHIERRLEQLSESFNQLGNVLTQVAVQDTRLSMIEKAVDDLRHGKGFVKDK